MSIKSLLIKNTGFNLFGYAYLLLVSFFSIPILLSNLGPSVFGAYIFLASFIPLASVFDFGVSLAVVRNLAHPETTKEDKIKTLQTSFFTFLSLAIIISTFVFLLLNIIAKGLPVFANFDLLNLRWSISILSLILLVNHVNNHLLTLPQAEQRFDIFNIKTFLVGTANTLISALVASRIPSTTAIFTVQLVFHLLTFLYLLGYSYKTFGADSLVPRYNSKTGRKLFGFGIKNFIGTLANQVENQMSGIILGTLSSATAITAFSIPQNIIAKAAGVISQFAQAFFPLSASLLVKDKILKLKKLVFWVELATFLGSLSVAIIALNYGQPFLLWWLKDPIVVKLAFPVLKILLAYFVLVSLTPVPTALCQGLNKPQVPSFFGVLTVAIEIAVAFALVPKFGSLGIAYAFLASVIFTVPAFLVTTSVLLAKEIKKTQSPV